MIRNAVDFIRHILSPPAFIIKNTNGKPVATRGKVTAAFIRECEDLCTLRNIQQGTIYGSRQSHGIVLEFSSEIPESSHQRFHNVWNIHR